MIFSPFPDDVDTELYRLLAAKAVQVNKADKKPKQWPKQNGIHSVVSTDSG